MSEQDEFLDPVDLSVSKHRSRNPEGPRFKALLLLALLSLWTGVVFFFFSRSSDEKQPVTVQDQGPEATPQLPEEIPTATPKTSVTPPEIISKNILIETEPSGVTIQREGQFEGTSPFSLTDPKPGQELRLNLSGYEPEVLILTQNNIDEGIQLQLKPILGKIRINILPENSTLQVNGKMVTLPENGILELPLRQQQLHLSAPGHVSEEHKILPALAYERILSVNLKPIPTATPVMAPGEEHGAEDVSLTNSQGIVMLKPAFPLSTTMGSPRGTAGRQSNEVEISVQLTREFRISKSEISNAQFRKFRSEHQSGRWKGIDLNADAMPVVTVSWEDAVAYCNWLSQQENLPLAYVKKGELWALVETPNTGYRLPTEAEWECLARIEVNQALFGWGDEMPPPQRTVNIAGKESAKVFSSVVTEYQDPFNGPAPVDQAHEGASGIIGLYGNVKEWVQDGYGIPPRTSKIVMNPLNDTATGFHVIKGASWRDAGIADLRIARRRYGNEPAVDLGFRIARYIETEF